MSRVQGASSRPLEFQGVGKLTGVLSAAILAVALSSATVRAATITILNADGSGEGFNDPAPRAPVTGNSGITLGQQRLNAFAAAAAYWANRLSTPVAITVRAQMNPLACTASSGILGSAAPTSVFRDFPGAPRAGTWYVSALANALRGLDLDPAEAEIHAQFNSSVDSDPNCITGLDWGYQLGAAPPAGTRAFYDTVVHEIAHGLGFLSLVDDDTGERVLGFDDIFMSFLEDHSSGEKWPQMSDGERFTSSQDSGDLHWTGPSVIAAGATLFSGRHPGGHVQMYAPPQLQPGSSVSHWDTALSLDEIMEPFATPNPTNTVTTALLKDIGWTIQQQTGPCVQDATTACVLNGRFRVTIRYRGAFDNNPADTNALRKPVTGFGNPNFETVFFYFNSVDNIEILLKMLDQGNTNAQGQPTIAVLFGSATPLRVEVTITDTLTGATKTYTSQFNTGQGATDFTAFVR